MAADKTNIVYFVLDSEDNPTEFAAIDTDVNEYMAPANLDPQTRNVTTVVADASGTKWDASYQSVYDNSSTWGPGSVTSGAQYGAAHDTLQAFSGTKWNPAYQTVTDNSATWQTGGGTSADEYGAVHDTVEVYSGTWQKITGVIDNLSPVSANIATNAANISDNADNIGVVGAVSANIATNTGAIAVLDDDVDVLGAVSANIATNTTNITTNTGAIAVLDDDVDVVGAVSANIATNTTNVEGVIDTLSPVSGSFLTSVPSAVQYASVHDLVQSHSGMDSTIGAWQGAWYRIFATSAGWNSTTDTVNLNKPLKWNPTYDLMVDGSAVWNAAADTATSGLTHGYGAVSGSYLGSTHSVSALQVYSKHVGYDGPSSIEIDQSDTMPVTNFFLVWSGTANKLVWRKPPIIMETGNVKAGTTGGVETLEVGSSAMPYPTPFGYYALGIDDDLTSAEVILGYSNTQRAIVGDTNQLDYYPTPNHFAVSADGWYKVQTVVILEGGSSLVDIAIKKNGADVQVGRPRIHSTVDPLEHSMQAIVECVAEDYITVTYDAVAAQTVKALVGSSVLLERIR
jgi:hypothetical protein